MTSLSSRPIFFLLLSISLSTWGTAATPTTRPTTNNTPTVRLKELVQKTLLGNLSIQETAWGTAAQQAAYWASREAFQPHFAWQSGIYHTQRISNQDPTIFNEHEWFIKPQTSLKTPIGTDIGLSVQKSQEVDGTNALNTFLNISQPLWKNFGLAVNQDSQITAEEQNQLAQMRFQLVVMQNITQTVQLYHALYEAQENQRIQQAGLAQKKALAAKTEALIRAGRIAKSESLEVQIALKTQELALSQAEEQQQLALTRLSHHVGLSPIPSTLELLLETEPTLNTHSALTPPLLQAALSCDLKYQSAQYQIKKAERSLKIAQNHHWPELNVVGSLAVNNRQGNSLTESFETFHRNERDRIGLELKIPFGHPYERDLERTHAKLQQQLAQLSLQEAKRETETRLKQIYNTLKILKEQLLLRKEVEKRTAQNILAAELKFNAGRISAFELVRIQSESQRTQLETLRTRLAYLNAQSQLQTILGKTLQLWGLTVQKPPRL